MINETPKATDAPNALLA
ncbi:hypothetical protein D020_2164A, partial [Vibrio parahaemolyticus SBR10290]